jgi:XTP/dITP diphosphohydrolase
VRRLVIATTNAGKAREIKEILSGLPFELVTLADFPPMVEPDENADTFAGNAEIKALAAADHTGELAVADDSGLVVDALDGGPGVYSSRFAPTDPERVAKLLDVMKDVSDDARAARFVCVAAAAEPGRVIDTAEGRVEGRIIRKPQGDNGFGYDPIFLPDGFDLTMAELDSETKNGISHRGRALEALKGILRSL